MQFTKMHGLGNDFVLVRATQVPDHVHQLAQQICDRHYGIGADGLVYLLPSQNADVQMRIFNSDGTESQQCGNAVRCVSKYVLEERAEQHTAVCTVETKRGIQTVRVHWLVDQVVSACVDMGEPILSGPQIPVQSDREPVLNESLSIEGQAFSITAVSMGNPHGVIEVDDVTTFDIHRWGPLLEKHPFFPERANIEFITVNSPEEITMRVWERGVGPTLACGSGACAVLVATALQGKSARQATIHLAGGDLQIEWREEDNHVYMTGPAVRVFTGEWPE